MTMPTTPATTPTPDASSPDSARRPPGDGGGRASTEVLHGLVGLVRPPERRATVRVLSVALLAAAICWFFGADVGDSILIAMAITSVGVSGSVGPTRLGLGDTAWRDDGVVDRSGTRSDVAELSWLLRGSHGLVDHGAVWRVRRLAQQRLALHRLDLLDPADRQKIEQRIGPHAYAVLVRDNYRPLLRSLLHCLDELDALDPTRPATPARSRGRMPILAMFRSRRARER